jgi:RND family efflux transporter MFP subunit
MRYHQKTLIGLLLSLLSGALLAAVSPVTLYKVTPVVLPITIHASGSVLSRRMGAIQSQVAGQIISTHLVPGQAVKKGEVVAVIKPRPYNMLVSEAHGQYLKAKAALGNQQGVVERATVLYNSKAYPKVGLNEQKAKLHAIQGDYESAKAQWDEAKLKQSKTQIKSGITGQVDEQKAYTGTVVDAGTILYTVVDPTMLKANVFVPENYRSVLKPGLAVQLISGTDPNKTIAGKVTRILPVVNPASRQLTVVIRFQKNNDLLPGGSVEANIITQKKAAKLVVPQAAIMHDEEGQYVFTYNKGKLKQVYVSVGNTDKGMTMVLDGLKAGEEVVNKGASFVNANSKVKVVKGD